MITLHIAKLLLKKKIFFSLQYVRMSRKNINFDSKKIKKREFYKNKKVNSIDDSDVNEILVSKKGPNCTKNSFK